ncbi:MAG: hypothetical protein ABFS32_16035 [Bacteroidota bacterium]
MKNRTDFFYMFSIALSFIVLGALGIEYLKKQYRGGSPTIIGAIFVLLAIQFLVLSLEQYFNGTDMELVRGGAVALVVFLIPGVILLQHGHKDHNKVN